MARYALLYEFGLHLLCAERFDADFSALLAHSTTTRSGRAFLISRSVSGRPPTSSEAAGPLEKKQNKHCFLAVTPPLSTCSWTRRAAGENSMVGPPSKSLFPILLADQPLVPCTSGLALAETLVLRLGLASQHLDLGPICLTGVGVR